MSEDQHEHEQRRATTNLSHLSLLFLHGSQFIAFLARFVGGRPSPWWSLPVGGGVLDRTVPVVALVLALFTRGPAGEVLDAGLLSAMARTRSRRRLGRQS
jgi:hypothetical protein